MSRQQCLVKTRLARRGKEQNEGISSKHSGHGSRRENRALELWNQLTPCPKRHCTPLQCLLVTNSTGKDAFLTPLNNRKAHTSNRRIPSSLQISFSMPCWLPSFRFASLRLFTHTQIVSCHPQRYARIERRKKTYKEHRPSFQHLVRQPLRLIYGWSWRR